MTKRNVQQHFVSAAYLAGFTPDGTRDSQLFVYERNTDRMFRTIPDEVAKRRNYYSIPKPDGGYDDTVDVMLTALEGQAMPALRKVLARDYNLSTFERGLLGILVAYQEFRTPWTRGIFQQMEEQLTTSTLHMMANHPGSFEAIFEELKAEGKTDGSVTPDDVRDALREKKIKAVAPPQASLPVVAEMGLEIGNMYTSMLWTVIRALEGEFVTSDAPVVRRDDEYRSGAYGGGLSSPTVKVWFPFSKKACVVIIHDHERQRKFFELLAAGRRKEAEDVRRELSPIREREADKPLVDSINHQTIENADRFVYSPFESADIANRFKGECKNMRIMVSPPPPIKKRQ